MNTCYSIKRPSLGTIIIKFGFYVRNMSNEKVFWTPSISSWLRKLERDKIWCIKYNASSEIASNGALIITSNSGCNSFNFDATMLIESNATEKDIEICCCRIAEEFEVYLNRGNNVQIFDFESGNYAVLFASIFEQLVN